MTAQPATSSKNASRRSSIGFFEKWLTVWVFLCIGAWNRQACCINFLPHQARRAHRLNLSIWL
jgi:hypothetical protein